MTRRALPFLLPILLPALLFASETRDPAAVAVAEKTLEAMGGQKAFAALRTLKFDFVVEHEGKELTRIHHTWDRWDGRYRIEAVNREGKHVLTIFNVQKPGEGRSWLDGTELAGEDLKKALERGYGRFINDSYWFLMPSKMLDPGVNLASEGDTELDGKPYSVVRLTFDGVGLTPNDTYWAFVSKSTGLMDRWQFVLTGQDPKAREGYLWSDWETIGGIRVALKRTATDGSSIIRFDHVSGSATADDNAFKQ